MRRFPELHIEYEGSITMSPGNNAVMMVVQPGGTGDGKTLALRRSSYY